MEHSPLGKLAPELRNRIYEPLLQRPHKIWLHVERRGQAFTIPGFKTPSITRVCQQMRSEAMPFFFNLNEFAYDIRFVHPIRYTTDIVHAFKLFGRDRTRAISKISINMYDVVGARRPAIITLIWTFAQMAILGLPLKAITLNGGLFVHIYSNREMKARLEEWTEALLSLGHGLGRAGFKAEVTMRQRYFEWQFEGEGRRFAQDEHCAMILARLGIRDPKKPRPI
ncbi:hypothetical protein M409DRAFT_55367 [Zasmidium cellare ATCC 36951]|uniref:Uncharacterized protein n=1 Tax=Zasmidium cellare ATCC 36951 TaxID=1080233 RepID=A0A6A6CKS2_ZASCE|nr:uncharacterized protein M409DRAFT_55367 [Zasmidium cellare ATCC 36951]KAF2166016.1 hypothetical protein M409DRAFT_55367 [Zasmidium cellare ATCC 36951]